MKFFILALPFLAAASIQQLKSEAESFSKWHISVRRFLHQHPELSFNEFVTSQYVKDNLKEMGISFTGGWGNKTYEDLTTEGGTGIVAEIGTGEEPCVALRADMDGLPIIELTDVAFKSQHDGKMHACGHDVHTSMLLGAAKLLKAHEKELKGTVRLVFQPAEEGGGGGGCMVEEGVLTKHPKVESIFGLHVAPQLPTGIFASRPGAFMAGTIGWSIRVDGSGGHAAAPYMAKDPIPVVAAIIQSIYTMIARQTSATDFDESGLISVTAISSPQSFNVIPDYAEMKGTIRALNVEKFKQLKANLERIATNTAEAFSQVATIKFNGEGYPPNHNNPDLYKWTEKFMADSKLKLLTSPPVMGGEDFAFYSQKIQSVFMGIGIGSGTNPPTNFSLHNAKFAADEKILPIGSSLLAHLAMERLKESSGQLRRDEM